MYAYMYTCMLPYQLWGRKACIASYSGLCGALALRALLCDSSAGKRLTIWNSHLEHVGGYQNYGPFLGVHMKRDIDIDVGIDTDS